MTARRWTIGELLNVSALYLKDKGVESPRLTAELLLALKLGLERVALYLRFDQPLQDEEVAGFRELIRRRLLAEPVAYIRGEKEFWSMAFKVGPGVLIPRPETELLVEQVLDVVRGSPESATEHIRILELGTGSGAVAVALAKSLSSAQVWATEISSEALGYAEANVGRHGVAERVHLLQGDLWEPVRPLGIRFDFVVSNPPYVASEVYDTLPSGVHDYEPRVALDGGERGMRFVTRIIEGAPEFLVPGGWLLIEMSPEQTETALDLASRQKVYDSARRVEDYTHRYRVVMVRRM